MIAASADEARVASADAGLRRLLNDRRVAGGVALDRADGRELECAHGEAVGIFHVGDPWLDPNVQPIQELDVDISHGDLVGGLGEDVGKQASQDECLQGQRSRLS